MNYSFRYLPFVLHDIIESLEWYKAINFELYEDLKKEIRQKLQYISENPLAFEKRYTENRIAFLHTFPYGIHFEIIENDNLILVTGFYHTARNPKSWKRR